MKVVFANRFFAPDSAPTATLSSEVAFDLAASGREVHAVTSRQRYDNAWARLTGEETIAAVQVHRLWTTGFGRVGLAGRALDYASFYVAATVRLLALLRRGDIVVAKTDPPLLSVCTAIASVLRGARMITWQQDVFPEVAIEVGFRWLGGPLGWPVRALRDWSLRTARANVVLGERMRARVGAIVGPALSQQVRVIPNWSRGDRVKPMPSGASALRGEWGLRGFVVGYSGNLGRVHDVETLVDVCRRLKHEPGIMFAFIGGGAGRARLERAVREYGLQNLRLLPYVEEARLSEALGACDVHLVTLLPAFEGLVVPSKFYGIAAAGRPTVYVGDPDGEIPRALDTHDIGTSVATGDSESLARTLLMLRDDVPRRFAMGKRARVVFEREWDRPIALAKWRDLIRQVAAST